MAGRREAWRRWTLGLATLLGRPRGIFIPYRDIDRLRPPVRYDALEPLFAAAAPQLRRRLSAIVRHLGALRGLRGGTPPAPRLEQDWFPRLDAAAAYATVREEKPARVVEIGSGHSTRFLARAIADGGLPTRLTAIDPAPRAALDGLAIDWIRSSVQAAGAAPFAGLAPGDILFVDSSHVLVPGSDVDFVINDVLPRLPPGALVHFHDIFLPDGYPAAWAWRGYNEQNAVALLLISGGWRLLWSSHWVATQMDAELAAAAVDLPLLPGARESSLWLEKL